MLENQLKELTDAIVTLTNELVRVSATPKKRAPKKEHEAAGPDTPEPEAEPAPEKKKRKSRAKKKVPEAQTEIETDGISLEDLSELAQTYCKDRGDAGANRIRKFLTKQGEKKLSGLSPEDRDTLATNLRK